MPIMKQEDIDNEIKRIYAVGEYETGQKLYSGRG